MLNCKIIIPQTYIYSNTAKDMSLEEDVKIQKKLVILNQAQNFNIDTALENAKTIVYSLLNLPVICSCLKDIDKYTYKHSINVAVYSVIMGIALNYPHQELYDLALGALLHDIGKKYISPRILNKPGKLTYEEFATVKKHPQLGYNLVKNNKDLNPLSKTAILQHHENEDGSGYPFNLKGHKINKFGKIIHMTDVYDALVSKRVYKEALSPQNALDYIKDNKGIYFDKYMSDMFLRTAPVYPKNSEVTLSNGEKGIVCKNFINDILRPDIKLANGNIISLRHDSKYKNIIIV